MLTKRSNIEVPIRASLIPRDYDGYVFISDIDKTYLATQIDSLGGLLRTAFEAPESKGNVPGFSIVLRAVRRGAAETPMENPLFFVSASPPQMRAKLAAKMEMDGIEHDGMICKNQLSHVRRGAFKKLREQIGYKLEALLSLWLELPVNCKIVLFGDDSESDAVVYSLFAEILAGNIKGRELHVLLSQLGVFREDALGIAWGARRVQLASPVRAAFINLETGSQASYYSRFGSFIYPTDNSLQTAIALYEQGLIRDRAVKSIGRELVLQYDFGPRDLADSLEAGARRGLYMIETLDKLWHMLHEAAVLPAPVARPAQEGAVTQLNPKRWEWQGTKTSLSELKKRYSDEGRY
ncbi:MAG: DUF2183 domain-containing protein [Bdellovibrionales bacterium]|nr:DUF2183 domain-containing protein [Bdellovibrionales bacterium]